MCFPVSRCSFQRKSEKACRQVVVDRQRMHFMNVPSLHPISISGSIEPTGNEERAGGAGDTRGADDDMMVEMADTDGDGPRSTCYKRRVRPVRSIFRFFQLRSGGKLSTEGRIGRAGCHPSFLMMSQYFLVSPSLQMANRPFFDRRAALPSIITQGFVFTSLKYQ